MGSFYLFLCCLVAHFWCSTAVPLVHRFVSFDDFKPEERLNGHLLTTEAVASRRRCAVSCLQTPACQSFNFQPKNRKCELNSADAFSQGAQLTSDSFFDYQGMKRNGHPICSEYGKLRNIQNDETPNFCQINLKRQDAKCGQWEETVVKYSYSEWKKIATRDFWKESHGGYSSDCENEKDQIIIEWFIFYKKLQNFSDAVSHCTTFANGDLFYRLNGTKEQLLFLHEKLHHPGCFWLGIQKSSDFVAGCESCYVDVKGNKVPYDLIVWSPTISEPSNDQNEKVLMAAQRDDSYFDFVHDTEDFKKCEFACDKLSVTQAPF